MAKLVPPLVARDLLAGKCDPHQFDRHVDANLRRSGEGNSSKVQHLRDRFQSKFTSLVVLCRAGFLATLRWSKYKIPAFAENKSGKVGFGAADLRRRALQARPDKWNRNPEWTRESFRLFANAEGVKKLETRSDQRWLTPDSAGVSGGYCVLLLLAGAILMWNFSPSALAQSAPVPATAKNHYKKPAPAPPPPLITETSPVPAPPPAPPPVLTPEQMPPRPPEVIWDGKLLSINAENSTLSDILVAVRARTGAAIDLPPATAGDRMAARFGPAPAREVLTSLLSGTNYDYIIQASETDEDGIQSVILTPRGKGEDLVAGSSGSAPGIRRPPGYTASGKHTFEVIPDEANTTPVSQDVASGAEGEQTGQQAGASAPESAAANAQPSSADVPPPSGDNANSARSLTASDIPPMSQAASAGSGSNGDALPTVEQRIQDMQRMFEQRRQIQAQQNQMQQGRGPAN
jgi:hypothetical protein